MTSCVESKKPKFANGYARAFFEGKTRLHHRVVYCQAHGLEWKDIAGKVVLHSCDNPACINPDHLILGTQKQNMHDKQDKGRFKGPPAVLTAEEASIIQTSVDTMKVLAVKYDVSVSTIYAIKRGTRKVAYA